MKALNLKSLFLIAFALITFETTLMAQNEYKVITKTLTSDTIKVSADSLWTILREFDKVADWTSTLQHSEGSGEAIFEGTTCHERVCEAPKNNFVEKLTMFSDNKKELSYELIKGAPDFVKLASNHWKVIEIGSNQSKVEMHVTIHLSKFMGFFLGGAITNTMTKQVTIVLNDLKIYAETGDVSEAKKAQLEKMKRN